MESVWGSEAVAAGRWLAAGLLFLLVTLAGCAQSLGVASGPGEVDAEALREHVEYLASDELGGREVGSEGTRLAEEYIAAAFQSFGLQPVPGRDSYFLDFTLYQMGFDPRESGFEVDASGGTLRAAAGEEMRPLDFSGTGEAAGELVFAGYGITAPEFGYDDYEGLDARGRIVLVLRHEPNESDPDSRFSGRTLTDHSLFTNKAANARRHGAIGLIVVSDPLHHRPPEDLRMTPALRLEPRAGGAERQPAESLPVAQISIPLARQILEREDRSLEDLQRALDQGQRPAALGVEARRARLRIFRLEEWQEVAARNVAGFLPGSDPRLSREWILIGAHHDHVGYFAGTGDTIFNGADDNASGTAGLLELARLFGGLEERPARSLVFVTFGAEERGLLGSRALLAQELIPVERLVFMLNLDMIGRNPETPLAVYGEGTSRPLREIVQQAAAGLDLEVTLHGDRIMSASDHISFFERNIPVLALFTGLHEDYHGFDDEAGAIAYQRMARVVALARETVASVAGLPEGLLFLHQVGWLGLRYELAGPAGRPVVAEVEPGSPAQEAGFQAGDILADERVASVRAGSSAVIELQRAGEPLTLEVQRPVPGYLGIVLREVEERQPDDRRLEYGPAIQVSRVIEGGPADRGGMQAGDILVELGGELVGTATLQDRLAGLGAGRTVEVEILREGRPLTLEITLGRPPASAN